MLFLGKHVNRCYLDTGAIGSCCIITRKSSNQATEIVSTTTETTTPRAIPSTTSVIEPIITTSKIMVDNECQKSKVFTEELQRRVSGDVLAALEQPWVVRIYDNERYICSGTLLKDNWVISAAQCFYGLSESNFNFGVFNPLSGERMVFKPLVILNHPKFDITQSLAYDVALVKLLIPGDVSAGLNVACVSPSTDIDDVDGTVAVEIINDQRILQQDPQVIDIQTLPNKECFAALDDETDLIFVGEQMACARQQQDTATVSDTRRASCQGGDIGSGFIVGNRAVIGVLSWEVECVSVFQRMAPIYSWIQNIINAF